MSNINAILQNISIMPTAFYVTMYEYNLNIPHLLHDCCFTEVMCMNILRWKECPIPCMSI
jgi:hypothetical protein